DLEWYAVGPPEPLAGDEAIDHGDEAIDHGDESIDHDDGRRPVERPVDRPTGYEQAGVVHGDIEIEGEPAPVRFEEVPARRWHRWGDALTPLVLPAARAHTGVRVAFRFPDATIADWVLTTDGWAARLPIERPLARLERRR